MRKFFLLVLSILCFHSMFAENLDTLKTRVYFQQGVSVLDLDYRDNRKVLSAFIDGVNSISRNDEILLNSVCIETGASPEGSFKRNEDLAMARARNIRKYLVNNLSLNASQIKAYSIGIDWEGLTALVRESDCPWKDEILSVISSYDIRTEYGQKLSDECCDRLKSIDGGRAWKWMYENIFGELRQGAGNLRCIISYPNKKDTVVIIYEYQGPSKNDIVQVAEAVAVSSAVSTTNQILKSQEKKIKGYKSDSLYRTPAVAIRTNLLMPLLNIGVEVPLSNRFSLAGDFYYPWCPREWMNQWTGTVNCYCLQGMGGFIEARWWLGAQHRKDEKYNKYRLRGHSLGLVVGGCYYDVEHMYMGDVSQAVACLLAHGYQGETYAVGIGYNYALPLGKRGGVHLEFEVALGYMISFYYPYNVYNDDPLKYGYKEDIKGNNVTSKFMTDGFYPIKVGINLVVPITYKDR